MKKVLFLVNHEVVIYNFRREIVERLITDGYEVHICCPYGELLDKLVEIGAIIHDIQIARHGFNPVKEHILYKNYKKLIQDIKPDICLGFTIKPNLYGAILSNKYGVPFVANITGLGTAVENPGFKQWILIKIYKYAFKNVQRIFFQNEENKEFFDAHGLSYGKGMIIPGSGVNLVRFPYREYPSDEVIRFAFISRIMKEKGIEQYLDAAEALKAKYQNVEFHVCGFCEPEYDGRLKEENSKGIVTYHGMIHDVASFMKDMNCIVHPTYYPEGMSNVLLEACATGRPIITTDRSGCREIVDDGINGYKIPCKNSEKLIEAMDKFINLSYEQKKNMGIEARHKVEKEFDRQIVVERYVDEVNRV